jgi:hypothetical protein
MLKLRAFKKHEKHPAPQREHPAIQNMKFLNFLHFLWVIIFVFLDPQTLLNPDSNHLNKELKMAE